MKKFRLLIFKHNTICTASTGGDHFLIDEVSGRPLVITHEEVNYIAGDYKIDYPYVEGANIRKYYGNVNANSRRYLNGIDFIKVSIQIDEKICECGKEKHGFANHSNWCPLYNEENK